MHLLQHHTSSAAANSKLGSNFPPYSTFSLQKGQCRHMQVIVCWRLGLLSEEHNVQKNFNHAKSFLTKVEPPIPLTPPPPLPPPPPSPFLGSKPRIIINPRSFRSISYCYTNLLLLFFLSGPLVSSTSSTSESLERLSRSSCSISASVGSVIFSLSSTPSSKSSSSTSM